MNRIYTPQIFESRRTICLLLLITFTTLAHGQYQIGIVPRVSPDKAVYQKIGYTEVEIRYGSPSVNDRQIWGDLAPYDQVWRAGANAATTVEFRSPVTIAGMPLDSGTYAFFLIPQKNDTWTAIFNEVPDQWGAFRYDETKDALRVEVRPRTTDHKTEQLTYHLQQTGFKYGSIILSWDFMEIELPFETNYLAEFEREIESRASQQPEYIRWIPYLQGAEHLVRIQDNKEVAKAWITKAESLMNVTQEWNEQFYPRQYVEGHLYWIQARILAWDDDYAAAVEYVEKLKALENQAFYLRKKESEGIDELEGLWQGK